MGVKGGSKKGSGKKVDPATDTPEKKANRERVRRYRAKQKRAKTTRRLYRIDATYQVEGRIISEGRLVDYSDIEYGLVKPEALDRIKNELEGRISEIVNGFIPEKLEFELIEYYSWYDLENDSLNHGTISRARI